MKAIILLSICFISNSSINFTDRFNHRQYFIVIEESDIDTNKFRKKFKRTSSLDTYKLINDTMSYLFDSTIISNIQEETYYGTTADSIFNSITNTNCYVYFDIKRINMVLYFKYKEKTYLLIDLDKRYLKKAIPGDFCNPERDWAYNYLAYYFSDKSMNSTACYDIESWRLNCKHKDQLMWSKYKW